MKKNKEIMLQKEKVEKKKKKIRNKTAQDTLPFCEMYENGMVLVERMPKGKSKFSICIGFSNANYALLKDSEQHKIYNSYTEIFNGLNPNIDYQELYINQPMDTSKIYNTVVPQIKENESEYDVDYRKIQEGYIKDVEQITSHQDFYIAISYIEQSKLDNPYNILMQTYNLIATKLKAVKSSAWVLPAEEYLQVLHKIYNPFSQDSFILPRNLFKQGMKIKDYIAPSSFHFKWDKIEMGGCYSRVLYVKGYATELYDSFINKILSNQYRISVSKHVKHIDKGIAVKTVNNRLKSLEGDRQTRKKKNSEKGTDYVPYALESEIDTCKKLLKLLEEGMELFDVALYIQVNALSVEDLDSITTNIVTRCRESLVNVATATGRQEDGIKSIVLFANDKLNISHYLLSDAVGVLLPFSYTSMIDYGGLYYGRNAVSKAPLIFNRRNDKNANCFILGTSGSGKSLYAKMEIDDVTYHYVNDRIMVIDREREFVLQAQAQKGQVINLSSSTKNFINPFDIKFSKDDDAFRDKSDLILSLMEVFKRDKLTAGEISIIDRCVNLTYKDYIKHDMDNNYIPTFKDFYDVLKEQKEKDLTKDLCLYLEMYVFGSCDIFAHKTNVDLSNSYVVFDILELGANLKKAAMFILLDCVWKQTLENYEQGIVTWLYADEMQEYFDDNDDDNSSGRFFERIFGRIRKRGGVATGMTQNATRILASPTATGMLQNAQFIILLEQKKLNLEVITNLYELSEDNQNRLKSPDYGEGVLIFKNIAMPFEKRLPKGNIVYSTLSTKFEDYIDELNKRKKEALEIK